MSNLEKRGWQEVQLGNIAKIIGGGTPSRKKSEYWHGTVPWLTTSDLSDYPYKYIKRGKENITKLGLNNSSAKLLPSGSILYSSRASIGYIAIAKNPIATSQGFKNFIPKLNRIDRDYLYYSLKYYTPLIEQIASGATYKEISSSELKRIAYTKNIHHTDLLGTPKVLENPQAVIVNLSISGLRDASVMCFPPSNMISSQSSSTITTILFSTAISAMPFNSSSVITRPVGL